MTAKLILPFGEAVLRKVSRPVEAVTPKLTKLLDDMADTLYASDGRAGLAAPQIGILRRVIVMDCGDGLIELINPEIVETNGEQWGSEACLSFPGYYGHVKRANQVKVTSMNRQGEQFTLAAEGTLARCIQHEIDHLNGVLFIDHVRDGWLYNENNRQKVNLLDVIKLSNHGL